MSLTLTDPVVVSFYRDHPELNVETINRSIVDILRTIVIPPTTPNNESDLVLNVAAAIENSQNAKFESMKNSFTQEIVQIINNANKQSLTGILDDYRTSTENLICRSEEKQNNIDDKITQVLKKFDSSNKKGNMSEMVTYNLLKSMYSENQLQLVNTTKETGDILLIRKDKPTIMIENKDYRDAVVQSEVDKFIRDINTQQLSGIFISQNSKIANKNHFEIAFYGNNVGIYLENVRYDTDIMRIAIDTVDAIKTKIKDLPGSTDDEEISLSANDLFIINNEYNNVINQKLQHIKTIKDFSKKLISETENINIPTLWSILVDRYGTNKNTDWICKLCSFDGGNKAGLASHMKAHDRAKQRQAQTIDIL